MMRLAGLSILAALCGCDDFTTIAVNVRPTVKSATKLRVTLTNDGNTVTDELSLGSKAFPLDFSYSTTGRTGDIEVQVDALTSDDRLVGRGVLPVPASADQASITIDGPDFVVNTLYGGDQLLSGDDDSSGFQLAANDDGKWTVAFRDGCAEGCDILARRFDANGDPINSELATPPNAQFKLSTAAVTLASTPALAAKNNLTLAVWDTGVGVLCRAIDQLGASVTAPLQVSSDAMCDVVSLVGLSNNNFAVTWRSRDAQNVIRTMIIRPDCTALTSPAVASTSAGIAATRPTVATKGGALVDNVLYAWILDGSVHIRGANPANTFDTSTDIQLIAKTATEQVEYVRVARSTDGFAVFARWVTIDETSPTATGKIVMYRVDPSGALLEPTEGIEITAEAGVDSKSVKSFGVASRENDSMFVAWHACAQDDCGVFGRFIAADGLTLSSAVFEVATTTTGDQTNPSVVGIPKIGFAVAWRDDSQQGEDTSGSSVRARILYSP
ncbi:MAG: hypothetical protein AB7O24_03365 [Kofleriaceae bacterium]